MLESTSIVLYDSSWDITAWTAYWHVWGGCLILVYIINAWLLGRIFKKAGVARWKAWIPVINIWNYLKIGGRSGGNIFWAIGGYLLLAISLTSLGAFGDNKDLVMAPAACLIAMVLAIICIVIYIYKDISATWNIQKKLGKSGIFLILYFINVVAPLWYWILALGGDKYNDKVGRPRIK